MSDTKTVILGDQFDTTIALTLDMGETQIRGTGFFDGHTLEILPQDFPHTLTEEAAALALEVAVIDGRIRVPDDVGFGIDLIGPNPRVRPKGCEYDA